MGTELEARRNPPMATRGNATKIAAEPASPASASRASAASSPGVARRPLCSNAADCSGERAASISKRKYVSASAQVPTTEYKTKQSPKSSSADSAAPAQSRTRESSSSSNSSRRVPRC